MTYDAATYLYASVDEAVARQLREVAEAMRQAEEHYRDLFDNAIEGLFQSTAEGRLVHLNPTFLRIFGYGLPQEVILSVNDLFARFTYNLCAPSIASHARRLIQQGL